MSYSSLVRCAETVNEAIRPPEEYAAPLLRLDMLESMQKYCTNSPFVGSVHNIVVDDIMRSVSNGRPSFFVVSGVVGSGKTTIAAQLQCKLIEKALNEGNFNYAYSYSFLAHSQVYEALFLKPLVHIPCSLLFNLYGLKGLSRNNKNHLEVFVDVFMEELKTRLNIQLLNNSVLNAFIKELERVLNDNIDLVAQDGRARCRTPRLPLNAGTVESLSRVLSEVFETVLQAYVEVLDDLPLSLKKKGEEGKEVARRLSRMAVVMVFDQIEGLERHVRDETLVTRLLADVFYALKNVMQNASQRNLPFITLLLVETRALSIVRNALLRMAPNVGGRELTSLLNTIMPNSRYYNLELSSDDAKELVKRLLSLCRIRYTDVLTPPALEKFISITGLMPRTVSQMLASILSYISQQRLPLPVDSDTIEEVTFRVRYPRLSAYLTYRYSVSELINKARDVVSVMFRSDSKSRDTSLRPKMLRRALINGLERVLSSLGFNARLILDESDRSNFSYAVYLVETRGVKLGFGLRFLYQRIDKRIMGIVEKLQNIPADRYYLVLLHRSQQIPKSARRALEPTGIEYHYIDCDERLPRIALYIIVKANEEFDDLFKGGQKELEAALEDFKKLLQDINFLPKGL